MPIIKQEYQPQTVSHPGEDLREKLEELQMSPKEFAIRCGKPIQTISEVMNGKSSITPDMAIQFENVLQIPARYWLQRQYHYNEAVARNNRRGIILAAIPWARRFPYSDMAKKGWVPPTRKAEEKAEALLEYFGVYSAAAWERVYIKAELKASFRISLAHTKTPHALSAWLRQGDIQARDMGSPEYSAKKLKAILPELKAIMAVHPPDFFTQAQALCLSAGVKVVFTPCLPKAPINGVARWIENNTTPLIQLSSRYQRNDIFWFSFFHELGHILLHGKKDVFLENVDYEGADQKKEAEADAFAVKWTLSEKEEAEVMAAKIWDEDTILAFAEKFGTHPAMIIGRLQHKGKLDHKEGRPFFVKLDWASADC